MTDLQQDMTAAFWEERNVYNVKFGTGESWNKYPQNIITTASC